jgi:hypothetical protein
VVPFPINLNTQRGEIRLENLNISELHWELAVIACHARAAVVIEAYD